MRLRAAAAPAATADVLPNRRWRVLRCAWLRLRGCELLRPSWRPKRSHRRGDSGGRRRRSRRKCRRSSRRRDSRRRPRRRSSRRSAGLHRALLLLLLLLLRVLQRRLLLYCWRKRDGISAGAAVARAKTNAGQLPRRPAAFLRGASAALMGCGCVRSALEWWRLRHRLRLLLGCCFGSSATDCGRDVRSKGDAFAVDVQLRKDVAGSSASECGGANIVEVRGRDEEPVLHASGVEANEVRLEVLDR